MSEQLFSCASFSVERTMMDGTEKYYVHSSGGSGIIALDDDNRILMTREYRPKSGKVHWRIPAGRAEQGEDLITCARRELREESGFDARDLQPFFIYDSMQSWLKQEKGFFIARGLFASPLDTGDEAIKPEVHFLDVSAVVKLLNDGEIVGDIAAALYRFLHVEKLI